MADIDEKKATSVASKYGARAFTDYRKMLEAGEVDAIHIATPDHLHTEPVLAALEAGKHVLVEKPMATTVDDARKVVATAQRVGRHVMVNYTHRWAAPYAHAEAAIRSGDIGKPLMVYARKDDAIWAATEMMSWTAMTSSASYLSTHDIDLVLWFLDTDVESVYAMGVKKVLVEHGIDTEDAIQALVRFSNGAIGTFSPPGFCPTPCPRARILSSRSWARRALSTWIVSTRDSRLPRRKNTNSPSSLCLRKSTAASGAAWRSVWSTS